MKTSQLVAANDPLLRDLIEAVSEAERQQAIGCILADARPVIASVLARNRSGAGVEPLPEDAGPGAVRPSGAPTPVPRTTGSARPTRTDGTDSTVTRRRPRSPEGVPWWRERPAAGGAGRPSRGVVDAL